MIGVGTDLLVGGARWLVVDRRVLRGGLVQFLVRTRRGHEVWRTERYLRLYGVVDG